MESAYSPEDARRLFDGLTAPWWIAGGWAIDCHLGRRSRRHEDLDVAVLRRDQAIVRRHLDGWDLQVALGPGSGLESWTDGRSIDAPLHAVWCRRRASDPWAFELLLNDADGRRWLFRRDHAIARPLSAIGAMTEDGTPYLRPEIVLLYKAKSARRRDQEDLRAVVPMLTDSERGWLAAAVSRIHPGHPWLRVLGAPAAGARDAGRAR